MHLNISVDNAVKLIISCQPFSVLLWLRKCWCSIGAPILTEDRGSGLTGALVLGTVPGSDSKITAQNSPSIPLSCLYIYEISGKLLSLHLRFSIPHTAEQLYRARSLNGQRTWHEASLSHQRLLILSYTCLLCSLTWWYTSLLPCLIASFFP